MAAIFSGAWEMQLKDIEISQTDRQIQCVQPSISLKSGTRIFRLLATDLESRCDE